MEIQIEQNWDDPKEKKIFEQKKEHIKMNNTGGNNERKSDYSCSPTQDSAIKNRAPM